MANPFLVLGGIAVGIVTAGFGILQVPGWIANAQDASAKNDVAQVSIGQAASLSINGFAQETIAGINGDAKIGVKVTTQAKAGKVGISVDDTGKHYAVTVESDSGKFFSRVDGGEIATGDTAAAAFAAAKSADTPADLEAPTITD